MRRFHLQTRPAPRVCGAAHRRAAQKWGMSRFSSGAGIASPAAGAAAPVAHGAAVAGAEELLEVAVALEAAQARDRADGRRRLREERADAAQALVAQRLADRPARDVLEVALGITFKYLDGTFERTVADGAGGTRYETGRWREERADAPTWYEIPYRAIVPKGAENVLAPGRCLDCDRDAYGACRVMVNCNQMGEAARRAAARALARGLPAADAFVA